MKNLDVKSKNESIAKSSEKKSDAKAGGSSGFFMFNPVMLY